MANNILKKTLDLLFKRQTNILSAAYIIMATTIFSQILGILRERLLISIFGVDATSKLGAYDYATILPDTVFQLTIAAALSSAFIPVFSDYLAKGQEKEGQKMASTLLFLIVIFFSAISIVLAIFAPYFLHIFSVGGNISSDQLALISNLMRFIIIGQLIFMIGVFFTALLQSYNHFFIPGFASAMYNLGIIIGIIFFHKYFDIYAVPLGIVLGAVIFVLFQLPFALKTGFSFMPSFHDLWHEGIKRIIHLMWPRTIQVGIQQSGTIVLAILISFMMDPLRQKYLFGLAKTLSYAPVALVGFSIAQAAFPVLSRERHKLEEFKVTFITSLNQMLYLILPISALMLVLRIPIVRLVYGADKFDWPATVLTGRTLALLSISIFAQALIVLFYRAFYALHNSVIPLVISGISTGALIILGYFFVRFGNGDIESVAVAFSLSNIVQLLLLFFLLDRLTGGFAKWNLFVSLSKLFVATTLTAFALWVPIKLLDQLVFDTTRTINLIILTGISSFIGCTLYLFLTWFLEIREAYTYIYILRRLGNWREILGRSEEPIETTKL